MGAFCLFKGKSGNSLTAILGADTEVPITFIDEEGKPLVLTGDAASDIMVYADQARLNFVLSLPVVPEGTLSGYGKIVIDKSQQDLVRGVTYFLWGRHRAGDGEVDSVVVSDAGAGYRAIPTIESVGGSPFAAATYAVTLKTVAATVDSGGTVYAIGDELTVTGGTGTSTKLTVTAVADGVITSLIIKDAGDYSALPDLLGAATTTGGSGTGATVNLTFGISAVAVSTPGSKYDDVPVLTAKVDVPPSTPGQLIVFLTGNDTAIASVSSALLLR